MSERKRGFLRPGADDSVDVDEVVQWGLPSYQKHSEAKETAMKYDPSWDPTFREEVVPEPELILTEEDIEQIRQGAYQEGLLQGQEAGFKQGYDKGKTEGYEAGHAEGVDVGLKDGLEQGQGIIQEQVEKFISLADQFAQPLELMNTQVERQLVDMVLSLVREVVHVEVQTNPQVILDTIKSSVEVLPITGHAITLKLNPEDVDIAQKAYGEEALAARQWTLLSEPSLNRGDIEIEAGESSVHYKMEERLRTVLQSFTGQNRHGGEV